MQLDGELSSSVSVAYNAALLQGRDTKSSLRDAWGNPKIPRIESLSHLTPDGDGWIDVLPANATESYSSLFGLPIVGQYQLHGNSSISIESSYLTLSCSSLNTSPFGNRSTAQFGLNITCPQRLYPAVDTLRTLELLGPTNSTNSPAANDTAALSLQIVYLSNVETSAAAIVNRSCAITQTHVESAISYTQNSCAVTRIIPSTTDKRPANYTSFDYWASRVLDDLNIANAANLAYSSPASYFLADSLTIPVVYSTLTNTDVGVELAHVPPDSFAIEPHSRQTHGCS